MNELQQLDLLVLRNPPGFLNSVCGRQGPPANLNKTSDSEDMASLASGRGGRGGTIQ